MNQYNEHPGFVAAKDQARAAYKEWRASFTSIGWEREQLRRRQEHIDNGATVRPDGRLEVQVEVMR